MKKERCFHAFALAFGIAAFSAAHAGPNAVVIEGAKTIGGCNTGLRAVAGTFYCPPDNPDGGRTPPGYFWNPTAQDLSQNSRVDRTGAFVLITQTGQYCAGNNLVATFNNGTTVDQGYSASCVVTVASGGGNGGGGDGNSSSGTGTGGVSDGSGNAVGDGSGGSVGGSGDAPGGTE
jgi:hypothetical protein